MESPPFFPGSHSVTHVPWFPAQLFSDKTSLIFTIATSKFWCWCWWHQRPNHFCHARTLSPTESKKRILPSYCVRRGICNFWKFAKEVDWNICCAEFHGVGKCLQEPVTFDVLLIGANGSLLFFLEGDEQRCMESLSKYLKGYNIKD